MLDPTLLTYVLVSYFCLLFSLCVHEAAHAAAANWCGDPTARLLGRLTLNPLKHIDPIGTVVMPLLMMFTGFPYLFGWAKPVPFNPRNLGNLRRDPVIIAVAGPFSNLLLAIACAFAFRVLILLAGAFPDAAVLGIIEDILRGLIRINLVLMIFNAIPVPPLDRHYVLYHFLPPSGQRIMEQIGPFGIIIAIMVARPWLNFFWPYMEAVINFIIFFGQS